MFFDFLIMFIILHARTRGGESEADTLPAKLEEPGFKMY